MDEVSTGSGSDRVRLPASSILLSPETRSLPLPVLTPWRRSSAASRRVIRKAHESETHLFDTGYWRRAIGASAYYQLSRVLRFPGDRGAVYDTWETANNNFKVRMKAYYEEGIYMPGAFYTFESASIGSDEWRELGTYEMMLFLLVV